MQVVTCLHTRFHKGVSGGSLGEIFQPFGARVSTISSAPTLSIGRPLKLPVAVDVETNHATLPSHVNEVEALFSFTALPNSMSSKEIRFSTKSSMSLGKFFLLVNRTGTCVAKSCHIICNFTDIIKPTCAVL